MSAYTNPTREHSDNIYRLIHLLNLAKKHGRTNVMVCMKLIAQGKVDYLEVRR